MVDSAVDLDLLVTFRWPPFELSDKQIHNAIIGYNGWMTKPDATHPAALRFNEGKPELHYILYYARFLEALAAVQMQGAHKYGYGNWDFGGKPDQEYLD